MVGEYIYKLKKKKNHTRIGRKPHQLVKPARHRVVSRRTVPSRMGLPRMMNCIGPGVTGGSRRGRKADCYDLRATSTP